MKRETARKSYDTFLSQRLADHKFLQSIGAERKDEFPVSKANASRPRRSQSMTLPDPLRFIAEAADPTRKCWPWWTVGTTGKDYLQDVPNETVPLELIIAWAATRQIVRPVRVVLDDLTRRYWVRNYVAAADKARCKIILAIARAVEENKKGRA